MQDVPFGLPPQQFISALSFKIARVNRVPSHLAEFLEEELIGYEFSID
jgi:hypothetical protein